MEYLRWIWAYLKGYRGKYITAMVIALFNPITMLINPTIQRSLIDDVLLGGQHDKLIPLVASMTIITLLRTSFIFAMVMLIESSTQGFVFNLRTAVYDKLQHHDRGFYNRFRTGDLMTTCTSDIDTARHNVAYVFRQIMTSVLAFVVALIYFFSMNVKFTLVLMAVAPLILLVSRMYMKNIGETYVELRSKLSELNSVAQENIEGNRVVKAFATEDFEIERFEEKNKAYLEQNLKAQFLWLRFYPYIEFLGQSMTITTLLFGSLFMMDGSLSGGELMAFSSLSWAITDPFRILGGLLNDMKRFFASADKVMEVLTIEPSILNKKNAVVTDKRLTGKVEFEKVSFSFGKNQVFDAINFTIEPGSTVAFMGETGSGKTTLANLITRFYDVKSGAVMVDGVDVKNWHLGNLRKNIGMSMQEVFLFSDTVDSNIAYSDPAIPAEAVKKYAHVASADFIENMPHGYQTIIGERGVGLSGGQRQRLALARALALEPAILILDDTTSAVDMETERFIQKQLASLDFSCTKIIIAQRVSSVKNADNIIILADGKISESGTHDELIAKQGYYYDVHKIQSGQIKGGVAGV